MSVQQRRENRYLLSATPRDYVRVVLDFLLGFNEDVGSEPAEFLVVNRNRFLGIVDNNFFEVAVTEKELYFPQSEHVMKQYSCERVLRFIVYLRQFLFEYYFGLVAELLFQRAYEFRVKKALGLYGGIHYYALLEAFEQRLCARTVFRDVEKVAAHEFAFTEDHLHAYFYSLGLDFVFLQQFVSHSASPLLFLILFCSRIIVKFLRNRVPHNRIDYFYLAFILEYFAAFLHALSGNAEFL